MNLKTKSMIIEFNDGISTLKIEGHVDPYNFAESSVIRFLKQMPSFLSEVAKSEEEYDKLFIEFRNKLSKYLYDEIEIKNIVDEIKKRIEDNF